MANIFQAAKAGEILTPAQRSLLKLIQGIVITAVLSGLAALGGAITQYFAQYPVFNLQQFLGFVGGAAASAIAVTLLKYFTAQGDQGPVEENTAKK
jgi:hypothetical protein